eukprot:gnl/MRDRNA2_/MRDRNA2_105442_c0_seq1.p1 gnl/MRDRNA2_/MRDRNA2_105442_c0~~gnl/MRDRNA2_/MRDRNA2_105442_c0_seq1.p1  ORF type:complete len:274 (+),score=81.76 gnl/MRDRNA2_/MRDRNA2_105442_c0_seq1:88-822(+)
MAHFQVQLGGHWKDYDKEEDNCLKRAYMTGAKKAKYSIRGGQMYEYDFTKMVQKNLESGKERDIRAPYNWKKKGVKPPSQPIASGPTMVVKVPPGGPGTVIQVPHPKDKSMNIAVEVPKTARVGAAMIVPVPPLPGTYAPGEPVAAPYVTSGGGGGGDKKKDTSLSAGEKAGFAVGGAALIGGMAVAGAVIGDAAADGAFDGAIADAGAALGDAGDVIGDVAGDAGDWLMDIGGDAGDFVMDLF